MKVYLRKVGGHFGALLGQTRAGSVRAPAFALAPAASGPMSALLMIAALVVFAILAMVVPAAAHETAAASGLLFAGITVDVSKVVDDIKSKFEEFKARNDERLAEIERKGSADAVLSENVDKINAAITATQGQLSEAMTQIRAMETAQARVQQTAAAVDPKAQARVRQFLADARGVPAHTIRTVSSEEIELAQKYEGVFARFLQSGFQALSSDDQAVARALKVQNAMRTDIDPLGGFLVSPDRSGGMVELIYESSPIRQLADVRSTSKDVVEGLLDLDEVAGGLVGEAEPRAETDTPTLGDWQIVLGEYYANPKLSQKQLDDSDVDVAAWLERKAGEKLGRLEAADFVGGTSKRGPRGFLTYATGTNSKTTWGRIQQIPTGQSGGFVVAANGPGDCLVDTVASVKTALRSPDSAWLMRRLTVAAVRKLKDGQNNYLWQPDFTKYAGGSLLGYAVMEGEDMPAIGANSLSIAFGNWKEGYLVYDHTVGIRVLRDPYTSKGQVFFYTTKRTGGNVKNFDALKVVRFGT